MTSSHNREAVYRAIADPTRRAMLLMLSKKESSATELASPFDISQPAASQHLRVLRDAGLVTVERKGRERRYRLDPAPLHDVYNWLEHFERFWNAKLDALGNYLNRIA
ncbi:MAG: winged helix-turn-helix transcriptional regulator [Bacteroidetes bacterium]|nr:winged helix-turn-helix transcriptional regulator [Bacteroidota bacterium]